MLKLYYRSPKKPIKTISVSCFNLIRSNHMQLELFAPTPKKEYLTKMLDRINNRWGKFVIGPATLIGSEDYVPDRIGFGTID
jgi:hypothetical protein